MTIQVLAEKFGICKLSSGAEIPKWASRGEFFSITHTADELSIVCPDSQIPGHLSAESNRRILKIEGPLDFSLTGILSSLLQPLADAKISVFTLSTFDTDYILLKNEDLVQATEILRSAGHRII